MGTVEKVAEKAIKTIEADAVKLEKELAKDGKYLYLFIVVNLIS